MRQLCPHAPDKLHRLFARPLPLFGNSVAFVALSKLIRLPLSIGCAPAPRCSETITSLINADALYARREALTSPFDSHLTIAITWEYNAEARYE